MDWKRLAFVVVILVAGLFFKKLLILKSVSVEWKYRIPIHITETVGKEYTDVPVQLVIDTESLINSGKMRPDCGDIRFYYVDPATGDETKIPYWIRGGCGTSETVIWIRVPYIPANSTITVYMYYGNPRAESESDESAFSDAEIVIGKYFEEHVLENIHRKPKADISDYCWEDTFWDAFDNYGYTYIYTEPDIQGESKSVIIKPYEVGGEDYRLQYITFSDGKEYIIYKDMLPGKGKYSTDKAVLRTVILPANIKALNDPYSVLRKGNLGSDEHTHYKWLTFECLNRTYRYLMTYDDPTPGACNDPNIAYFMFCAGHNNQDVITYNITLNGDRLSEKLYNAKGLCVLYLAPTDNVIGDEKLEQFFCQEIQYFEQFVRRFFKVDNAGNIIAAGVTPPPTNITIGEEERISLEPDIYGGVDIQIVDTYERSEFATIYAKLDMNLTPTCVALEIIDADGVRVYGPVNMTEIAPLIYSYKLDTSVLEPGTYLVRVLVRVEDDKVFGGIAPIKIQTQFAELKTTIKEEIAQVKDYLETTIYPKLVEIETEVNNLTSFSYTHLLEIKHDLEATYNEILILEGEVRNINATLYNELQDVKQKTEEILSKVNIVLDLIQNTVIIYLQGISNKVDTIHSDVEDIKQEIDYTIVPKLNIIEVYLQNINETISNINESIQKEFKDLDTQLELLDDNVERILLYVDEVETLLKCESFPEDSTCDRLEKLRQDVLEIKSDVFDIKTAVQDLDSYIRNVLMPKIDDVYYNTEAILNNQTKTYNKLIEAYQEIQEVRILSDNIYTALQNTHTDLANKLEEQSQKLDTLNQTVYQTLLEIREKVLPKLDSISTNLDVALEKLEIVRQKIDCDINSTVCSKLNTIINDILILKQDVQEVKTSIEDLEPIKTDISQLLSKVQTISNDVDQVLGKISTVSYETKEIKEALKDVQEDVNTVTEALTGMKAGMQSTAGVLSVIPAIPSILGIVFVAVVLLLLFIYLVRKLTV